LRVQRSTWLLGAVAAAAVTTSVVLYVQKRDLEAELAARPAAIASSSSDPWQPAAVASGAPGGPRVSRSPIPMPRAIRPSGGTQPELTPQPTESRLERRVRRRAELAAMLGRLDGETDEEYRARMVPLIKTALAKPRADVDDLRKQMEAKAGVTAEQHAKLDAAFDKVYDDLLDYTNSAVADRELDPYQSNVAGMLDYAGGLGAILQTANGRIGTILTPEQQRAFTDSGFEWAEYLGVHAPWERLNPPPPPH
jgi:hypothetical protein